MAGFFPTRQIFSPIRGQVVDQAQTSLHRGALGLFACHHGVLSCSMKFNSPMPHYANQWSNIEAWHNEMAQFIRTNDVYHHLITSSSDLTKPIWDQTDYYQHHDYPSDLITGIRDAQDITAVPTGRAGFQRRVRHRLHAACRDQPARLGRADGGAIRRCAAVVLGHH